MKKGTISLIVIGVVLLICCGSGCSKYNSLVASKQEVESSWSNVETQYQRRADLIPNLVETVKGYASHEATTLQNVTEARARVGAITLNVDSLDEASLKRYTQAQNELSSALKSLLSVTEAYPDLKANENFLRFQDEYAGTENRIQTARRDYNEVAKKYNTEIAYFPANIVASLFHFTSKPYFSAAEGAEVAPTVKF
jgi:LemA protein